MSLMIEFDWDEVGHVRLSPSNKLEFPPVPSEPGVYSFRMFRMSSVSGAEVYIGETQDLHQRMNRNYRTNHTGKTNVYVRRLLYQGLSEGRSVQLALVRRVLLEVDGAQAPADFHLKVVRLLIESAAVVLAGRVGEQILNRFREPLMG
jgi:hypothetical protein